MQSRRFGGAVPEHLQSHFLAVRPRLFNSDEFWNYWQKMALPKSYEQSVIRTKRGSRRILLPRAITGILM